MPGWLMKRTQSGIAVVVVKAGAEPEPDADGVTSMSRLSANKQSSKVFQCKSSMLRTSLALGLGLLDGLPESE